MPDIGTWYSDLMNYFRDVAHVECGLQEHNGSYLSCKTPQFESAFTVRIGEDYHAFNRVDDLYCLMTERSLVCTTLNGEYGYEFFKSDAGSLSIIRTDAYSCGTYPERVSIFQRYFMSPLVDASPDVRSYSCTEQ